MLLVGIDSEHFFKFELKLKMPRLKFIWIFGSFILKQSNYEVDLGLIVESVGKK